MAERIVRKFEEDESDLGFFWAVLCKVWWKIVLLSSAVGVVTLLYMFIMPNIYKATAVITPAIDEKKQNPALGAFASLGVTIGGPSSVEELESLFKSDDLTVRVFTRYNLWSIILSETIDHTTGKGKRAWTESMFGDKKEPKPLSEWDAIRAAKSCMRVSVNKKIGTVSLSFESPSAEGSATIVKYYLDEGKNSLQEEALGRATKNKKFIEEQIGKTVDALTRDRLYYLYSQEVEREMMARNREQFGFRVIDSPRVPDRKFKPNRTKTTILAIILSFLAGCVYFVIREKCNRWIRDNKRVL